MKTKDIIILIASLIAIAFPMICGIVSTHSGINGFERFSGYIVILECLAALGYLAVIIFKRLRKK